MKTTLEQAVALANMLKIKIEVKRPNNNWGGYANGSKVIYFNPELEVAKFVDTCRNCGDGNWTDVTEMCNLLTGTKNLISADRFIEIVSDLANTALINVIPEQFAVIPDPEGCGTKYSDEAQEVFNQKYDEIEAMLNISLNTYNKESV